MKSLIPLAAVALSGLAALAAPVAAATAPPPPRCDGSYELIRSSTVKPGRINLFLKAVRDHQAWYAAHGMKDRILVGRVLGPDADASGFSPTVALTIHTDLAELQAPAHAADDAAWNAYIAEYRDSSDLIDTKVVCREAAPD